MSDDRSRAEHLAWAKTRALEYLENGDVADAIASLASDLSKHPATRALAEGATNVMNGILQEPERKAAIARAWIEGIDA